MTRVQAVVMNYRDQPEITHEFHCEFSEALAMIHEDAAVFWDRDGHSLAEHSRDHVTIGIWDQKLNPRRERGCVVVVPYLHGTRYIILTDDLRRVDERDRGRNL